MASRNAPAINLSSLSPDKSQRDDQHSSRSSQTSSRSVSKRSGSRERVASTYREPLESVRCCSCLEPD